MLRLIANFFVGKTIKLFGQTNKSVYLCKVNHISVRRTNESKCKDTKLVFNTQHNNNAMKTEITKSIKEVAEEVAKRLAKRFCGRAEVRSYLKCADVLFYDPKYRCNYADIINEASAVATMHGKHFNHVYIGGTVLVQYFD